MLLAGQDFYRLSEHLYHKQSNFLVMMVNKSYLEWGTLLLVGNNCRQMFRVCWHVIFKQTDTWLGFLHVLLIIIALWNAPQTRNFIAF